MVATLYRACLIPGLPMRGWECRDVIDLNPDEEPAELVDYGTCQVCGQHPIRFVHVIAHPDWEEKLDVGCVCVEHLTKDYVNPRRREKELGSRARRRRRAAARWSKRHWRRNERGTYWLKIKGFVYRVFPSAADADRWQYLVTGRGREYWGQGDYPSFDAGRWAIFGDLFR